MKKVFSRTDEVCAIWAAQSQDEARTGSNTSFRGTKLYSYGTCIANIVTIRCERVALVSSLKWSDTTSVVQGQAETAAKAVGLSVFVVPSVIDDVASVIRNLDHFDHKIADLIDKIVRAARWDTARRYRADALEMIGVASMYARTFDAVWSWTGPNPLAVISKREIEFFQRKAA